MKRYPAYKDSGIDWIGGIPLDWELKKIKRTAYVKGRIGWQGLKTDEYLIDGFAYLVTGTDFLKGVVNWDSCFYVEKFRYDEDPYIQLKDGDLLITKDGTIGKIALVVKMDKPSTLNSGIFLVRPKNSIYSTNFLYWILNSNVFTGFFEYYKSGSTIGHLYQNVFVEFLFSVPPKFDQDQIVAFLNFKTHQIDDLIAKKQKFIELVQEERTAIINQAVTKGLNPDVPMKDSGIEWLGEIPACWETKRIKFLTKSVKTGTTPPSEMIEFYEDPDVDWFTPSDFNGDLLLTNSNRKINHKAITGGVAKIYPPLSVLIIGIGATLGKIGMIDKAASSNQQINAIEFNNLMNPSFGSYFLKSYEPIIKNMSNAATLAILNQTATKNLIVTCPPIEEQNKIVEYLSTINLKFDSITERTRRQINLLTEYKTSLINDAVTGKIDIRDYQINHA